MRVDLLDYELPERAIAQRPAERREMARMLVLDPAKQATEHRHIHEWPSLVPPGSLVVLNDTKVVKARLLGVKERTGGKAELLLVEPIGSTEDGAAGTAHLEGGAMTARWRAIGKGLGALGGQALVFGDIVAEVEKPSTEPGLYDVRLTAKSGTVMDALANHGHVPLPPYMRRSDEAIDAERYQTVYARVPGAIAAPTAGLHMTDELLAELRRRDVEIAHLTLHVGLGTFQPVAVDDLDQHPMHTEWMQTTDTLVQAVANARARGGKVIAVGTTVVRALESAAHPEKLGAIVATERKTNILLQPGYSFRVVDALLTNFHLPRSTLLALVAAFAGRDRILAAYREAVSSGYRFYSYGDAMWIANRAPREEFAPSRAVSAEVRDESAPRNETAQRDESAPREESVPSREEPESSRQVQQAKGEDPS